MPPAVHGKVIWPMCCIARSSSSLHPAVPEPVGEPGRPLNPRSHDRIEQQRLQLIPLLPGELYWPGLSDSVWTWLFLILASAGIFSQLAISV